MSQKHPYQLCRSLKRIGVHCTILSRHPCIMSLKLVCVCVCIFSSLVYESDFRLLHKIPLFSSDEDVINGMHRFRPAFFVASKIPTLCDPIGFKHTCVLQAELVEEINALKLDDGKPGLVTERRECLSVPYVTSNDFRAMVVFENFKLLIKEVRVPYFFISLQFICLCQRSGTYMSTQHWGLLLMWFKSTLIKGFGLCHVKGNS